MQNKIAYVWTFVGKFLPEIIYLATTIVLARFLTPTQFGQVGAITVFIAIANTLYDSGLGGALIKERNISIIDKSTVWIFNITVSSVLYLMLYISAPSIERYMSSPGLSLIIRLISLVIIFNSFSAVSNSILIKELQFKYLMIVNATSVSIGGVIAIILGILGLGVFALVFYQLVVAIIKCLLINRKCRILYKLQFSASAFRRLFSFGLYTTLSNIIDSVYENGLAFLYGKVFSIKTAGYLSQAKKLSDASTLAIAQTIGVATFPIISKLTTIEAIKIEAFSIEKYTILFLTPLILIISIFSTPIIELLFGQKWIESGSYLSLLMIGGVFVILENLNRNFIKGTGQVRKLFKWTLIKRVIGIGLILMVMFYNKEYILYGYIGGAFIGYLFNMYIFSSIIKERLLWSLRRIILKFIPIIIWYIISIWCYTIFDTEIEKILFPIILLFIYYIVIMKINNINLSLLFKHK